MKPISYTLFLFMFTTGQLFAAGFTSGLNWGEHNGRYSCTIKNMLMSIYEEDEFKLYTGYEDGPQIGEDIDLLFGVGTRNYDNKVVFYTYMGPPTYNKTKFMLPYIEISIDEYSRFNAYQGINDEPTIFVTSGAMNMRFSSNEFLISDFSNQLVLKKDKDYENHWAGYYFYNHHDNSSNLISLTCLGNSKVFNHIYNYFELLEK